jgi:hypothetical protein
MPGFRYYKILDYNHLINTLVKKTGASFPKAFAATKRDEIFI